MVPKQEILKILQQRLARLYVSYQENKISCDHYVLQVQKIDAMIDCVEMAILLGSYPPLKKAF